MRPYLMIPTFGSVFAFVVNRCTRQTLLNIAPYASVKPVDSNQARAWQTCKEHMHYLILSLIANHIETIPLDIHAD